MRPIAIFLFLLLFSHVCQALEHIVLYTPGETSMSSMDVATTKGFLEDKGYRVSLYRWANNIEDHIANAERINKSGASFLIALSVIQDRREDVLVAVADFRAVRGRFLRIDEVHGRHREDSRKLGELIALPFGKKLRELPLFPLLGIDMPGVFLMSRYTERGMRNTLIRLEGGMAAYIKNRKGNGDAK